MKTKPLAVGDQVEISAGAFQGMAGKVLEIRKLKVVVAVSMFGKPIPTEVGWSEILRDGRPVLPPKVPASAVHPPPPDSPLLRAVLDCPADDLARGCYADWREQQGDPHHEYLRTQIELAQALRERRPFEALLEREQYLRQFADPAWVFQVRRLTTEPRDIDIERLVPDLAQHARVSVRLHRRRGPVPDPAASKLGGLFLWPEEEPWPVLENLQYGSWYRYLLEQYPDLRANAPPEGADVPLAPILQLRAQDIPNTAFPRGKDLLQLFWSPFRMEAEEGPRPFIFWRNQREIKRPRRDPPHLTFGEPSLSVSECRLYPEPVVEYPLLHPYPRDSAAPGHEEWMAQLCAALNREYAEIEDAYIHRWSVAYGSKVGGYPCGGQHPVPLDNEFGQQLDFLLSLPLFEIATGTYAHWAPLEDRGQQGPLDVFQGFDNFFKHYFVLLDRSVEPWGVSSFYDIA